MRGMGNRSAESGESKLISESSFAELRLSVLFAESLSLREIQSRVRARALSALGVARPTDGVAPGSATVLHMCTWTLVLTHADITRTREGWTHGRNAHAIDPRFCAYVNSLPDVDRRAQGTQLRGSLEESREKSLRRPENFVFSPRGVKPLQRTSPIGLCAASCFGER